MIRQNYWILGQTLFEVLSLDGDGVDPILNRLALGKISFAVEIASGVEVESSPDFILFALNAQLHRRQRSFQHLAHFQCFFTAPNGPIYPVLSP